MFNWLNQLLSTEDEAKPTTATRPTIIHKTHDSKKPATEETAVTGRPRSKTAIQQLAANKESAIELMVEANVQHVQNLYMQRNTEANVVEMIKKTFNEIEQNKALLDKYALAITPYLEKFAVIYMSMVVGGSSKEIEGAKQQLSEILALVTKYKLTWKTFSQTVHEQITIYKENEKFDKDEPEEKNRVIKNKNYPSDFKEIFKGFVTIDENEVTVQKVQTEVITGQAQTKLPIAPASSKIDAGQDDCLVEILKPDYDIMYLCFDFKDFVSAKNTTKSQIESAFQQINKLAQVILTEKLTNINIAKLIKICTLFKENETLFRDYGCTAIAQAALANIIDKTCINFINNKIKEHDSYEPCQKLIKKLQEIATELKNFLDFDSFLRITNELKKLAAYKKPSKPLDLDANDLAVIQSYLK